MYGASVGTLSYGGQIPPKKIKAGCSPHASALAELYLLEVQATVTQDAPLETSNYLTTSSV